MQNKLSKAQKEALDKAKENANKDGYFEVSGDPSIRNTYDELKRLGYVKQHGDWTGFDFTPVTYQLKSPAYFYDDYEAANEWQLPATSSSIINVTGSQNVQVQQMVLHKP